MAHDAHSAHQVRNFRLGQADITLDGIPDALARRLVKSAMAIAIETKPLQSVVIPAEVFPLTALPGGRFIGGVRAHGGGVISFADVRRHDLGSVVAPPPGSVEAVEPLHMGEAIFGGVLFSGYGHILLETLNRLWYASTRPDLNILFAALPGREGRAEWTLLKTFAQLLGLDPERLKLTNGAVVIDRLHVPQPGLELGLRTSLVHVDFIRTALQAALGETPRREAFAYISRSRLEGPVRKPFGERALEQAISASSNTIYWPEQLSLYDQVRTFNAHPAYGGFIGSHLHNLLLRFADGPVDCVYLCGQTPNVNFLQIDMLFPGRRIYSACSRYDPVFEFGNRAPFRIDRAAASRAFHQAGLELPLWCAESVNDATYVEEWAYLLFHYKVFRPLHLRVANAHSAKAQQTFLDSIDGLIQRLLRRNTNLTELRPALLTAYDRVAVAHRRLEPGTVAAGRALLADETL